jgi:2-polyprenyl-3-methyl-5-hydroxy-6-metoxy-1,4-benzoquinol methylase
MIPHPLSVRRCEPEWMDELDLDPALHHNALSGLERINIVSLTVASVWQPLLDAHRQQLDRPLSVLDVACGAGDLAIGLAQRARARGIAVSMEGCDISQTAIDHARRRAVERGATVTFFQHDALTQPLPQQYDVVVCALFLHHLDEGDATRLLTTLGRAARSLLIVTDLDRSRLGLALAWIGTRLLTRSPVVHVDSLRSVRAAWTRAEAEALATRAGLSRHRVHPIWPCRWRLLAEGGR